MKELRLKLNLLKGCLQEKYKLLGGAGFDKKSFQPEQNLQIEASGAT